MYKTINFELNQFPTTPHKLREVLSIDNPAADFVVNLSRLYHHYYTDFWGVRPPNPDHTNFEYLRFLDSCRDFRFLESRVSVSSGQKRTISNYLGQAFCRYFLYEFCDITYFAHMDKVLNKELHPAFNGMKISRVTTGDVPDYLCAKSVKKPYIAEAKGRFSNISFNSEDFNEWREQFNRIRIYDKHNIPKRLKGFIVGTKFSTSKNRASNTSRVMAEDPETTGEESLNSDETGLGLGCVAIHYSRIISKLGLQLLASSLEDGFVISEDLNYRLPVWECSYPPLKGKKFVGGFFSDTEPQFTKLLNGNFAFYPNILKLGIPSPSFYGLSAEVFKLLKNVCLGDWKLLSEIKELPEAEFHPSNLSWLRDGSITGVLDFFEFVGMETF